MAERRLIGIASITVSNVDGSNPQDIGTIYKETAEITQEQDSDIEHFNEESDEPFKIVPGAKKTKIKWAITNFDPDVLVSLLGGVNDGGDWTQSAEIVEVWRSLNIIPKLGGSVCVPRALVRATIDYKLTKSGIAKLLIEATAFYSPDSNYKLGILG